jgi:hypothetical protein
MKTASTVDCAGMKRAVHEAAEARVKERASQKRYESCVHTLDRPRAFKVIVSVLTTIRIISRLFGTQSLLSS